MAENYPSNIAVGENYSVYVNVGNHLGYSAYYVLYLKFGNMTDQLPNSKLGTPSSLSPIYEYRFSIPDNTNWQRLLKFSINNAEIQGINSQIHTLQINKEIFNVDKFAIWNPNCTTFTYRLFLELWRYSDQSVFFDSFVMINLNLTGT